MSLTLPHGPTFYERTDVGLPLTVHNLDGITKRPVLANRLKLILCHYTGVPVNTRRYANVDTQTEIAQVVQSINRWRRNEYNYVLTQSGDIVEFAGRFQGAHCGSWPIGRQWNPVSYGCLFLNASDALDANKKPIPGTGEPITWAQIQSFGWLKNVLRWTQQVAQDVAVEPHSFAKPTGCPGPSVNAAMDGLRSL